MVELAQVLAGGDQFPLAGAGLEAAALEAADAAVLFDVAEDRLDHPAALLVQPSAALGRQLAPRPLAHREPSRDAPRGASPAARRLRSLRLAINSSGPASASAPTLASE